MLASDKRSIALSERWSEVENPVGKMLEPNVSELDS